MAPGDLRACGAGCGVWVAAAAGDQVLSAEELRPSRLTSWARERVGCPMCSERMRLYGLDMTLFQGCADHGFWIDRETVAQTGLGRPANAALLAEARTRARALHDELTRAEREARAAEEERARQREAAFLAARDAQEEQQRAARREEETRAVILERYVRIIEATYAGRVMPLAELLDRHDRQLHSLRARVDELERLLAAERARR